MHSTTPSMRSRGVDAYDFPRRSDSKPIDRERTQRSRRRRCASIAPVERSVRPQGAARDLKPSVYMETSEFTIRKIIGSESSKAKNINWSITCTDLRTNNETLIQSTFVKKGDYLIRNL